MIYQKFDCARLRLKSLDEREHDLDISVIKPLQNRSPRPKLADAADIALQGRKNNGSVIFMMGGHVIRSGVQNYLIDLMQRKIITCMVMNGACIIHDFELAMIGKTTESVEKYIKEGQFGLWQETGRINDIVAAGIKKSMGLGESVGRFIWESDFPYKQLSLLGMAWHCGVPVSVSVGIGSDIIHEHPNFDGAAFGAASHLDFLRFAAELENIGGGLLANFGSAVAAPEVFLKALAMVKNALKNEGRALKGFTTLVCDLVPLPENPQANPPSKSDYRYYFRPWKTMLVRTVSDGRSIYVQGPHVETIPEFWTAAVGGTP
nr:hypothetical protein [uncultured Desulfobacter sp.]